MPFAVEITKTRKILFPTVATHFLRYRVYSSWTCHSLVSLCADHLMVDMKSRHIPGTLIALPNYERTTALCVVFPRREGSFSSISTQVNEEAKGGGEHGHGAGRTKRAHCMAQAYLFTKALSNIGSHWLSYCLLALPTLIIPGTLLI